jgi:uncharacterized caspase-like protein
LSNLDLKVLQDDCDDMTKGLALVIGNAEYRTRYKALVSTPRDAQAMTTALQRLRYIVDLVQDLTLQEMLNRVSLLRWRIRQRAAKLRELDRPRSDLKVFVHFSGHGEEIDAALQLLPVDAGAALVRPFL